MELSQTNLQGTMLTIPICLLQLVCYSEGMRNDILRMVLFWPLTVIAALVYFDIWAKLGLPYILSSTSSAYGIDALPSHILAFLILVSFTVIATNVLVGFLTSQWTRQPRSNLILFIGCWILAVIIFLNPNVFAGLSVMLHFLYNNTPLGDLLQPIPVP